MKHLIVAAFVACAPVAALSAPLTLDFTGTVDRVNDGSNVNLLSFGPYNVGDAVSGSIVLDVVAGVATGTSFSMTIDGNSFFDGGGIGVTVANNQADGSSAPERDYLLISDFSPTGPDVGGIDPARIQFAIGGTDTSVLSDTTFPTPTQIFSLFDADTIGGNLNFLSFADGSDVRFSLDTLLVDGRGPSQVPLPAALPMLLAGMGALRLIKRKQS